MAAQYAEMQNGLEIEYGTVDTPSVIALLINVNFWQKQCGDISLLVYVGLANVLLAMVNFGDNPVHTFHNSPF